MFRKVPLSIISSFSLYTQQWYISYSLRAGSGRFRPDPARKLSGNLYDIYLLLCVQWKTPDNGQRNCLKHVEFYSKNKFEKLVHLVGFIADPARKLSANLYDIYLLLCVQWKTPDNGQRNCLKHVEFYSKNKFEKLVHLVGFIIRIYHDARSYELQKRKVTLGIREKHLFRNYPNWRGTCVLLCSTTRSLTLDRK